MADTSAATGLTVQQWDDKFWTEYVHQNRFASVMGTSENSIIQIKSDLTKKKGDKITFALVNRLTGAGVTGSSTLEGNEEDMDSRSHALTVDQIRHAVRVSVMEEQKSAISLRNAGRMTLKTWAMEKMRDDIIAQLASINGVLYGSASEANKDAWLVDNTDRVLFGAALSNHSTDHSAALGAIDTTNDLITASRVQLLKRIAKTANPKIRPIRTTEDEEWYILYVGSLLMRDLAADSTISAANRDAWQRGRNNPIFTGGDLIYDGVIIKEIPDIGVLSGVGDTSSDVGQCYLCGAQAVGIGWAMRSNTVTEEFDYKDKHGVAVREIRGIDKMTFGSGSGDTDDLKDNGLVTGFFSATADA